MNNQKDSVLEHWEAQLDDFDAENRQDVLEALSVDVGPRPGGFPAERPIHNLHAHTFFSYNAYGFSPAHVVWMAKRGGFEAIGMVDFDVLDGVDEFFRAAALLDLRATAGVESRVFIPEFETRVINSPGEPGIAYHVGLGFASAAIPGEARAFLARMRETAAQRTRALADRVNAFTAPVSLDFERDVQPLTPAGNATERHLCLAYARAAAARFSEPADLAAFWTGKLGPLPDGLDLPDGPGLQNLIRAKTMKRGGVGYVQPDANSFPTLADMNRFIRAAGAIPMLTWLDGTSDGERCIDELFAVHRKAGAAAVNLIPDRNFKPGIRDEKLQNLYAFVAMAEKHHMPVTIGTELNSPGQKFVDDFDAAELQPLVPVFRTGMYIAWAHTALQRAAGLGYLSPWAAQAFESIEAKNAFYREIGERLRPSEAAALAGLSEESPPAAVLQSVRGAEH